MDWDPVQYSRYSDARSRPFYDLVGRIGAVAPRRVVDLGCGPGPLTAALSARWPSARVEGIDSSEEMIASARTLDGNARLSFRVGDAATWVPPSDCDVIVSNALLQWVPAHRALIADWAAALPADGWLAFQVPGNFDSPSHVVMRELASSPRWKPHLDGVLRHDVVASPREYAELLQRSGLTADVWETTYLHVLRGADPVLEWVRGTGLRPVLSALTARDGAEFSASLAARLRAAYPPGPGGTLFAFRRIFAVGTRA